MSIAGNLKTMQLAELLQWLSQAQKTGTLVINAETVEKRLFFDAGAIISSSSTAPSEYLGQFLVDHGLITAEQLEEAMQQQAQKKMLLGKILVSQGAVTEDDLHSFLRLKAEETIYDIFTWDEGEFRFLDGELPDYPMIPLKLNVTGIIMEGARRVDEWRRIREVIPSKDAIPVSMLDLTTLEEAQQDERLLQILSLVDDKRTVEEIQQECHSSEFNICSVLYEQVQQATIKVVQPRIVRVEVPVPAPAPAAQPAPAAPAPMPTHAAPPPAMPYPQQHTTAYTPPPAYGAPPAGGYPQPPYAAPQMPAAPAAQPSMPPPAATPAAVAPPPTASSGSSGDTGEHLDPDALLAKASQALVQKDFERALRYLRAARSLRPEDRNLEAAVQGGIQQIRNMMEKSGVKVSAVPKLAVTMDQLTGLNVTAQEGFVLTRLDGKMDIKSIIRISPLSEIDGLVLFWKMHQAGHIRL